VTGGKCSVGKLIAVIFFLPLSHSVGLVQHVFHHVVIMIRQLFLRLTWRQPSLKLEWVLTTANAAGTNSSTCLSKHGGARDNIGHTSDDCTLRMLLSFHDGTLSALGHRAPPSQVAYRHYLGNNKVMPNCYILSYSLIFFLHRPKRCLSPSYRSL
jgi:hypothetical protein